MGAEMNSPIRGRREHSLNNVRALRPHVVPAHPALFDRQPERAAVVLHPDAAAAIAVELERFRHLSPHPSVLAHLLSLLTVGDDG